MAPNHSQNPGAAGNPRTPPVDRSLPPEAANFPGGALNAAGAL